jgi:hypothetical protein
MEAEQSPADSAAEIQENQKRFLRHMESLGLVVRLPLAPKVVPPRPFERVVVTGEPLSQTIIQDRR